MTTRDATSTRDSAGRAAATVPSTRDHTRRYDALEDVHSGDGSVHDGDLQRGGSSRHTGLNQSLQTSATGRAARREERARERAGAIVVGSDEALVLLHWSDGWSRHNPQGASVRLSVYAVATRFAWTVDRAVTAVMLLENAGLIEALKSDGAVVTGRLVRFRDWKATSFSVTHEGARVGRKMRGDVVPCRQDARTTNGDPA